MCDLGLTDCDHSNGLANGVENFQRIARLLPWPHGVLFDHGCYITTPQAMVSRIHTVR